MKASRACASLSGGCVLMLCVLPAACNRSDPDATGVRVSSTSVYISNDEYKPENMLDGNDDTIWAAGGSSPATLTFAAQTARTLESVTLVSRQTELFETWQRVTVRLYCCRGEAGDGGFFMRAAETLSRFFGALPQADQLEEGEPVFEETFPLPTAATERTQTVELPPTRTDRISLRFSEPVTTTLKGDIVSPAVVNPGYSEVVLNWRP